MRNRIIQLLFGIVVCCTFLGLAAVVDDADFKAAKKDHDKHCARCHGDEGKGDGRASELLKVKPADWTDASRMAALSDEQLFLIIEKGGKGTGKSKLMPSYEAKLDQKQINRLVAFVKSFQE